MLVPATPKDKAALVEIFSSSQGEGPYVGFRQIFIRFCGCNLECAYCDTDHVRDPHCRVETAPGSQSFDKIENPVSLETIVALLEQWQEEYPTLHHSISLTGGEPLHHGNILRKWLPELRKILPIYLETNGTQPSVLADTIDDLDYVSMDIKLASVCGFETPWNLHGDFLLKAKEKVCCVKVVVDMHTPVSEVKAAAELVKEIAKDTPLIIQPLTRADQIHISSSRLLELQSAALQLLPDVRIIPQTHRFLDLL